MNASRLIPFALILVGCDPLYRARVQVVSEGTPVSMAQVELHCKGWRPPNDTNCREGRKQTDDVGRAVFAGIGSPRPKRCTITAGKTGYVSQTVSWGDTCRKRLCSETVTIDLGAAQAQ